MEKFVGGIIFFAVVAAIFMYVTAIVSVFFCIIIYFICKANNPVIRKFELPEVIVYSFGWGLIVSLFFAFSSFLVSDIMFGQTVVDDPKFWIDGLNFGIVLSLSAFVANRVAVARRFRGLLVLAQPAFIFLIGISVTILFDIYIRQLGDFSAILQWEKFKNFDAYEFIGVVQRAVEQISNDLWFVLKDGYTVYAESNGSAFSLMPFITILLIVWTVISFFGKPLGLLKKPNFSNSSGNGDALKVVSTCLGLNVLGFVMIFIGTSMVNGMDMATGNESMGEALIGLLWGIVSFVIIMVCMIGGAILTFLMPFFWTSAFATASLSPSASFINRLNIETQ